MKTVKSTKVTEQERVESLPELKRQIRSTDPNLSAQEVDRRAAIAAGLDPGISEKEAERRFSTPRAPKAKAAVQRGAKVATTGGARKLIFGVMVLAVGVGWFRDVRKGISGVTDAMPRRLAAAFIAGFLLMLLAGPAPRVAKGLAVLIGFSVVAFNVETARVIGKTFGATPGASLETPGPQATYTQAREQERQP